MQKLLIIGCSSDIGNALLNIISNKFKIIATYNKNLINKKSKNIKKLNLDISKINSIDNFVKSNLITNWDHLLILPGDLNPIGKFEKTNPKEIIKSINLNFTNQIYLINKVINLRNKKNKLSNIVITSGPASNSANEDYFSYSISKVALIKSFELLNKEFENINFIAVGPGMLNTKIHNQTFNNKKKSIESYINVKERLANKQYNSLLNFCNFLNYILKTKDDTLGGRNISFEFDEWRDIKHFKNMKTDNDMHKLRRSFNNFSIDQLNFDIDNILEFFFNNPIFQKVNSEIYILFKRLLHMKISMEYQNFKKMKKLFNYKINFPFVKMGNINSIHLFGIDELFILKFYHLKRNNYKIVCDIGANIGLHTTLMSKVGFKVYSFEPDPYHFKLLKKHCKNLKNVKLYNEAISDHVGNAKFTRIIDNTTGSFINANKKAYGPIDVFNVKTNTIKNLHINFDLIKIDAEGSEIDILGNLSKNDFKRIDIIMEISTPLNRKKLWLMQNKYKFNIFSQKNGWEKVKSINSLPTTHREGSVFLSYKKSFL